MSCPVPTSPVTVNAPETESLSPTPSVAGEPEFVKKPQKASELPLVAVMSKVTDPTASVRVVVERPSLSLAVAMN